MSEDFYKLKAQWDAILFKQKSRESQENKRLREVVRDLCDDLISADWKRFEEKVDKIRSSLRETAQNP